MKNFSQGVLSLPVGDQDQRITITVESPWQMPDTDGRVSITDGINYEIVRYLSANIINDNVIELFVYARGYENTIARSWAEGTRAYFGITAGTLESLLPGGESDLITFRIENSGYRVFSTNGGLVSSNDVECYDAIADYDRNVIVCDSDGVKKYDIDGDLVWSLTDFNIIGTKIAIDKSNAIYYNGGNTPVTDQKITRIDKDGNVIWEKEFTAPVRDMVCSGDSALYYTTTSRLEKINKYGEKEWDYTLSGIRPEIYPLGFDEDTVIISSETQRVVLTHYLKELIAPWATDADQRCIGGSNTSSVLEFNSSTGSIQRFSNGSNIGGTAEAGIDVALHIQNGASGMLIYSTESGEVVARITTSTMPVQWRVFTGERYTAARTLRRSKLYMNKRFDSPSLKPMLARYMSSGEESVLSEEARFEAIDSSSLFAPLGKCVIFVDTDNQCKVKFDNGTVVNL